MCNFIEIWKCLWDGYFLGLLRMVGLDYRNCTVSFLESQKRNDGILFEIKMFFVMRICSTAVLYLLIVIRAPHRKIFIYCNSMYLEILCI